MRMNHLRTFHNEHILSSTNYRVIVIAIWPSWPNSNEDKPTDLALSGFIRLLFLISFWKTWGLSFLCNPYIMFGYTLKKKTAI